jgi:hypothetical protein
MSQTKMRKRIKASRSSRMKWGGCGGRRGVAGLKGRIPCLINEHLEGPNNEYRHKN